MFRWFAVAALVGCLGISSYYRRRARSEGETIARARESPRLRAGRALVAGPLFLAILAYMLNPGWMAWAHVSLPIWARWGGVVLGLLTVPAAYWVFVSLGGNVSETILTKKHHELVTSGPYRWIRHPLYTTGLTLFLGIGLMAANWFILVFGLIGLASMWRVVIPMEERELLTKFGEEYGAYMRQTGRLLPRVLRGRQPQ